MKVFKDNISRASDLAADDLPRACVSTESFARADPAAAHRIVTDLGPDRVHVVYTARRIDRLLPSHWQQRLRAQLSWPYHEYLRRMLGPDDGEPEWRQMWGGHDVRGVVERWTQLIPRDRMTVVVADEQDHDLLPRTFGALLGVPPAMLRTPAGANRSLTLSQAEAVRRVNALFAEHGWSRAAYKQVVQLGIARTLKSAERAPGDRLPGPPADLLEALHERSDAQADALLDSGVGVVGDPETLRSRGRVTADDSSDTVDAVSLDLLEQVLDGALQGAFTLRERGIERARRQAVPPEPSTRELVRELARRVIRR